jgi:uncharacterized protein YidB (DUF937 family)
MIVFCAQQEANMGLLDVLNGMQNGPRGASQPGKGGMSPITMALLGLLAYKAVKSFSPGQPGQAPAGGTPAGKSLPGGTVTAGAPGGALGGALGGGGLGDLLQGKLGGLLAGGAAGSVLTSGLNDLLKQFEQSGQGDVAKSWVGTGANKQISPADLEKTLGHDTVKSLADQAGLSSLDLLSGLSQHLPGMVDHMTPQGRVPTSEEMSRMV